MWREVDIQSWSEFNNIIDELDLTNWIFRGQSNSEWDLQNSLYREILSFNGVSDNEQCKHIENKMYKEFQSSSHLYSDMKVREPEEEEASSFLRYKLDHFSIMQHYGAPTRLIDWTYSPYIATFFALDGATKDFAIYSLNVKELESYNKKQLGINYTHRKNSIFWGKLNHTSDFVFSFDPIQKNERIRKQQGLFLVPSVINKTIYEILFQYGIKNGELNDKLVALKFVIKSENINEYWHKLKQMNITHETIYPGFDGFCKSLKLNIL
ncbi:FRG domain-containing protein [Psychrobacillus antarcticus]|uniref:FRG domain-containing protein n=1 Tax=Psychrobacillus antarcticus TaxID=2879115 RepID=UPI002407D6A9|nr:FRG domain-containing protein [Psychrobacillus antarcticus]